MHFQESQLFLFIIIIIFLSETTIVYLWQEVSRNQEKEVRISNLIIMLDLLQMCHLCTYKFFFASCGTLCEIPLCLPISCTYENHS